MKCTSSTPNKPQAADSALPKQNKPPLFQTGRGAIKERVKYMYRDKEDGTVYTFQQVADEFDSLKTDYPTIYNYSLFAYISKFFDEIQ